MSPTTIVIAGFTGRISRLTTAALLAQHPDVEIRGITRSPEKVALEISSSKNVKIFTAAANDVEAIREALRGADVCICGYLGDNSFMLEAQRVLIDACITEGVPRYIASDYSIDYRGLALGDLPPKDPVIQVRAYLEQKEREGKIKGVHILSAGFTEVTFSPLGYFDAKTKTFWYWGTGNEPIEMTAMADVGAYTAAVAVDPTMNGFIKVYGDRKSVKEVAKLYEKVYGTAPKLECRGSLEDLYILMHKTLQADPQNVFAWLGLFYAYYSVNGTTYLSSLDNAKFPTIKPKTVEGFLESYSEELLPNSLFI